MIVLDAGAFIAAERNNKAMRHRINCSQLAGERPVTSPVVIAQVWRGDARRVTMARLVRAVRSDPLTRDDALKAGALLALSGTSDVVDALLMLTAKDGDIVYTSDPGDLTYLAGILGLDVEIVPV
jgi:predicted nucleic acid-binding protein